MIRFVLFLVAFCPFFSDAITVNGDFTATKPCPAYLSKNKKTNPGNVCLKPRKHYVVREINRITPQWFRIEHPESAALRWVNANCGKAHYQVEPFEQPQHKSVCKTPGLADGYVLALSWQPAFCETHGFRAGKPECRQLQSGSYAANHFVLHGLWPNQTQCGIHYGYCGVDFKAKHCQYSPLILNDAVVTNLKQLMPSFSHGSCLERHEWYKHGSCQVLSADDYFSLAIRLTKELNQTEFTRYIQQHIGTSVERARLREVFEYSFGERSAQKLFLGCRNGRLVDVFINLPVLIPSDATLSALIQQADATRNIDKCPPNIVISDFSHD